MIYHINGYFWWNILQGKVIVPENSLVWFLVHLKYAKNCHTSTVGLLLNDKKLKCLHHIYPAPLQYSQIYTSGLLRQLCLAASIHASVWCASDYCPSVCLSVCLSRLACIQTNSPGVQHQRSYCTFWLKCTTAEYTCYISTVQRLQETR